MSSESGRANRPARAQLRSLLFVPATHPESLSEAAAAGADAAILDLEDAVADHEKRPALARVAGILDRHADAQGGAAGREEGGEVVGTALFVRINPLDTWSAVEELRAIARPGLTGVVLPKVRSEQEVRTADRLLTWSERDRGLPAGSIALVPLLETAQGLRSAQSITAAASRTEYTGAVTVPGGEVERARGRRWGSRNTDAHELRSRVLQEVRAAGAEHPVAGVWTLAEDLQGLRRFAEQNRSIGYAGMLAVSPSHVPVINEVFSPDAAELARAERLIAAVREAQAQGASAAAFEGRMVDEAMAAEARRLVRRHRGAGTP